MSESDHGEQYNDGKEFVQSDQLNYDTLSKSGEQLHHIQNEQLNTAEHSDHAESYFVNSREISSQHERLFDNSYQSEDEHLKSDVSDLRYRKRACPNQQIEQHPNKIHSEGNFSAKSRKFNQKELSPCNFNNSNSKACFVNQHSNNLKECSSTSSVKHINDLPVTILLTIFRKLTIYDLLRRVGLVSRYWSGLAVDPSLWQILVLKDHQNLTDELLERVISYSDNISLIDLSDCKVIKTAGITKMLSICKRLKVLKMARCSQLGNEVFEKIAVSCPLLHTLDIEGCHSIVDDSLNQISKGCPRLQKLRLNHCSRLTSASIIVLSKNCPDLKKLDLEQCSKIQDDCMEQLVSNCKKIHQLHLMACDLTPNGLFHLKNLKKLEDLQLSQIIRLTPECVNGISHNLRELNLSLCTEINDVCIDHVARNSPHLHTLYLVSCSISNQALFSLSSHAQNIIYLDVSWCRKLTDDGVNAVIRCPKLRYLGLMRCDEVTVQNIESLMTDYPHVRFSTMWLDWNRILQRARQMGHDIHQRNAVEMR